MSLIERVSGVVLIGKFHGYREIEQTTGTNEKMNGLIPAVSAEASVDEVPAPSSLQYRRELSEQPSP